MTEQPMVRFDKVSKRYGSLTVLDGLDLDIGRGEKVSIIGPSGSGKTTVLRMLMTLETINDGVIWVEGEPLTHMQKNGKLVPADTAHIRRIRSKIGMVLVLQPVPAHDGDGQLHRGAGDGAGMKRRRRGAGAELLEMVGLGQKRATTRRSFPAASSSAWRSPARSPCGRRSAVRRGHPALDPELVGEVLEVIRRLGRTRLDHAHGHASDGFRQGILRPRLLLPPGQSASRVRRTNSLAHRRMSGRGSSCMPS